MRLPAEGGKAAGIMSRDVQMQSDTDTPDYASSSVRGLSLHLTFTRGRSKGFTLIELMIVLAIMGVLITIAQPNLKKSIIRAREAVLREDLYQMRDAIDQYYADNGKYPSALADLTNPQERSRSYLREIPKDPFTGAD